MKYQKTKIVATVGPASESYKNLVALMEEGVDTFRLNFSHGSHEQHLKVIDRITKLNAEYNVHIGILADLQGPKIRVGKMEGNGVPFVKEDILTIRTDKEVLGNKDAVYINYQSFASDVNVGERILVDDGKLVFEVTSTNKKNEVKLKTLFGGTLCSNKGVNLPNTKISLPCLTEKDLIDLEFILTQPVNWIALSFVRSPKDIKDLKKKINKAGHPAKIIAKIEKPEAVDKLDKIISASNGIMVARGDLGIEVPMEKLPGIQKEIIQKCIQKARPVIVATQMMESMLVNPSPSRAEISDVANAVLDGADAVMLSGETSVGAHPCLVVEAMTKILFETEKYFELGESKRPIPSRKSATFYSDVVCFNAAKTANDVGAKGIVGLTTSGYTAFKVSSFRPKCSTFIFSDLPHILATLNLVWGVKCYYYDRFTSTDETIEDVTNILKENNEVKVGDVIINTGSMPMHRRLRTNMLKVTIVE